MKVHQSLAKRRIVFSIGPACLKMNRTEFNCRPVNEEAASSTRNAKLALLEATLTLQSSRQVFLMRSNIFEDFNKMSQCILYFGDKQLLLEKVRVDWKCSYLRKKIQAKPTIITIGSNYKSTSSQGYVLSTLTPPQAPHHNWRSYMMVLELFAPNRFAELFSAFKKTGFFT